MGPLVAVICMGVAEICTGLTSATDVDIEHQLPFVFDLKLARLGLPKGGFLRMLTASGLPGNIAAQGSPYKSLSASHTNHCQAPIQIAASLLSLLREWQRPPTRMRIDHRLGWIRLGYGEMTEEFRVPSDHLESPHFAPISIEISLVLMTSVG